MLKRTSLAILVLLLPVLCLTCSKPAQPPATPKAPVEKAAPSQKAAVEKAAPAVSETATKTEAALEAKASAAPAAKGMPPDHWLVGTSTVEDMMPAVMAPEAPRKLLNESGNAYLEQIGDTRVLHLKGTYYDMGVQHGTLMKKEIVEGAALIKAIGSIEWKDGYDTGIRGAWDRTSPFIPQGFKDEMQGMADATGMTVEEVQNFSIFPELFHCSGFALWGKATADGALLHGRVLDYMRDAGLDKYALIIIQEPEGANAFVNVGYSGTLGSVTGMNVKHVGIGEMGGKGQGQWDGVPMTFLVRDCLEKGNTKEDVRRMMQEAKRTCQYYYVVSDSTSNDGKGGAFGVAAEPGDIQFIEPNQSHPLLARPFEDAVLLSAGDRYTCLADRVQKMYGKITPQIALDIMARGVAMKSNMHDALFKPATLELWVANSTIEQPACNRPYTHYDLNVLMKGKPSS